MGHPSLASAAGGGPLVGNDAKITEGLHGGFDVAAHLGPILARSGGIFFNGDDAAVGPGIFRDRGQRFRQIGEAEIEGAAAGGYRAQDFVARTTLRSEVGIEDAETDGGLADDQKGIGPALPGVDAHVDVLRRQRNAVELLAVLIAQNSGGAGLLHGMLTGGRGGLNGCGSVRGGVRARGER